MRKSGRDEWVVSGGFVNGLTPRRRNESGNVNKGLIQKVH